MAKKEVKKVNEKNEAKNREWAERYASFGKSEANTGAKVQIENIAACNIVENGVDIKHVKLVKPLHWVMFADILVITLICTTDAFVVDNDLISTARGIATVCVGWSFFEIIKKAIETFKNNTYNIEPAVQCFTSPMWVNNMVRAKNLKQAINVTKEDVPKKVDEIKNKLIFDIDKKIFPIFLVFLLAFFLCWGYVTTWDMKKAVVYLIAAIPVALLVTLSVHIVNTNNKKQ